MASTLRFVRALSGHAYLKALILLQDEGIRVIVDALGNNTIMQVLDIRQVSITHVGLADITRLLLMSTTRLQTIYLMGNNGIVNNDMVTREFVTALVVRNATVLEMHEVVEYSFPAVY